MNSTGNVPPTTVLYINAVPLVVIRIVCTCDKSFIGLSGIEASAQPWREEGSFSDNDRSLLFDESCVL